MNTETKEKDTNTAGKQSIKTSKTRELEGKDTKILIGKKIEKVKEVQEEFDTLQRKMLNKMMK